MSRDLKPNQKKRIKDAIKEIKLTYQIIGEEIPSVVNTEYRCEAIQFYDIQVTNIKEAAFLASTYQSLIKPFCILHIFDSKSEVYSLAVKRLSQLDNTQIIVENSMLTEIYQIGVPDSAKERFLEYMDFTQLKNKMDKVGLYKEWYFKAYMIANEKAYAHTEEILKGNCWYDERKTARIVGKFIELVSVRESLKKAITNAERLKINKDIKTAIRQLDIENN